MMPILKTFRLINDQEIRLLEDRFTQRLQTWNQDQALFPLTCTLQRSPMTAPESASLTTYSDDEDTALLLLEQDLSALKYSLFGNTCSSFDSISARLLSGLLTTLVDASIGSKQAPTLTDWFYPGSASLLLQLHAGQQTLNIYLHPQWVLNALPIRHKTRQVTGSLEDALHPQTLDCQVELQAFKLPLDALLNLRVGDLISSDHPLASPLLLKHQQQTICQVRPGANQLYKSIKIESPL